MRIPEKTSEVFRKPEDDTSMTKLRYLELVDIFRDLGPAEMKEVEKLTSMTTCQPGKIFFTPKQMGEILFILKKGRVQLYRKSGEGRKLVLADLGPGSVFGEMMLTGQGLYDAFAEATEESLICIMNRKDVEKLIMSKPQVAIRLLDLCGKRLQEVEERLESTLFRDVPSRLASLLMRLRTETSSDEIAMTHEQLAEHLGVYRETVTAALNNLRKEGLITIGRKHIEINDLLGLQKKSSG